MPIRCFVSVLLGAAHIAVMLVGACACLPERSWGPSAQLVRWYGHISGGDTHYGFFAPDVGTQYRARFILCDARGHRWEDRFDHAANAEARLRLMGIVDAAFMTEATEESLQWRQTVIKSWAATMFSRHPEAISLKLVVEVYDVPTLAEYRAGSRPSWRLVYQADVERAAVGASERIEK